MARTNDSLMQCLKEEMLNFLGQDVYITMDVLDKCPNKFGIPFQREEVPKVAAFDIPEFLNDERGQRKDIIDCIQSVVRSELGLRMEE